MEYFCARRVIILNAATDHSSELQRWLQCVLSSQVRDVEAVLHRVKTDLHNCVGFIQEPKKLKESIRQIYERYVQQSDVVRWTHTRARTRTESGTFTPDWVWWLWQVEIVGVDADVRREYSRQREHMERNMDSLKQSLVKDIKVHEAKNIKLMKVGFHIM